MDDGTKYSTSRLVNRNLMPSGGKPWDLASWFGSTEFREKNCNANFREDGQANEESLTDNLSAGKVLRLVSRRSWRLREEEQGNDQNVQMFANPRSKMVTSEAAWRYFFSPVMSGSMRLSGQLGVEMTSQRTGRQTRKEKKTIVEDVKIQQCETPALLHQAQRFMCSCSAVDDEVET
ncbi:predicted protein [Histoplasma capsulatum G186AR]|uniref:Uncharacterized protein n=1 Tax=Ajellomyces capsulatus (strain G186AR / H82 / ATCC MYA-2454 / RMSCC 2432) TaxID=447093 RepID=C0NBK2_AJECG|nr:uncharacterized protein HCBG_00498 [Histoplasma capsulatum G186AR]EEH11043.1 predicted protein [Histoplasma capsulatum G186AR]